jgi:hypothetical protein
MRSPYLISIRKNHFEPSITISDGWSTYYSCGTSFLSSSFFSSRKTRGRSINHIGVKFNGILILDRIFDFIPIRTYGSIPFCSGCDLCYFPPSIPITVCRALSYNSSVSDLRFCYIIIRKTWAVSDVNRRIKLYNISNFDCFSRFRITSSSIYCINFVSRSTSIPINPESFLYKIRSPFTISTFNCNVTVFMRWLPF